MAEEKRRFTVITNTELEQEREEREREKHKNKYEKARQMSYQTNPLKEQFMRFTNEEAGKRFSVEDLLKW